MAIQNKLTIAGALMSLVFSSAAIAAPGSAHVHGVAALDVAIDGRSIELHLETPLVNLLGFEHPPASAAQHQAVARMKRQLEQPGALFGFPAAAGCVAKHRTFKAPSLADLEPAAHAHGHASAGAKAHSHSEAGHRGQHDRPHQDHADLEADYAFECSTPAALTYLDIALFKVFPGVVDIHVQIAGPKGQASKTLNKAQSRLTW